jgi:hypothetical protein
VSLATKAKLAKSIPILKANKIDASFDIDFEVNSKVNSEVNSKVNSKVDSRVAASQRAVV